MKGERFDGHDYLAQARAAGAVAALAEHGLGEATLPGLQVADSLLGLQQLAAAWRAQFSLPLIAVTGSNGKTTVTQMLAAMLRAAHGDAALATAGNLNNHIGVPLTLLRLRPDHRAAVLELGMNHEGEIARLAQLARPTVALVNNAQREHQEFMASVEAVARENGAVIAALPADGTAVIPADEAYTPLWRALAGARRVWTFGLQPAADTASHVWARATWQERGEEGGNGAGAWQLQLHTPVGGADTTLALAGRHNVANAAAATACALAAGLPLAAVARGLAGFQAVKGRSQLQRLQLGGRTVTLIDDSYNANPDSVLAAIALLAELPGPRWLVLGDMGEVGSEGPRFHAEVGAAARAAGIEHFWAAGKLCAHAGADRHFDTVAALLAALPAAQPAAASVLVKGSRFMQMELCAAATSRRTPSSSRRAAAGTARRRRGPARSRRSSVECDHAAGRRGRAASRAAPR
ncbi:MAG: UDP-N-acetylmuramoylalanyl-D-glutamyl-2, 6-diaminopimelate--D-alanyl-D-alanine ligase [Leptothrix sp. (in: Bacteria)]|nr:UDP-N-acetylmuramoylalanyl-D-glutamyl-2, 6-diaminopimelate--D-alanyl-D-alanine ligase [Leptothrix sp. (in: b-proteobacteria)]